MEELPFLAAGPAVAALQGAQRGAGGAVGLGGAGAGQAGRVAGCRDNRDEIYDSEGKGEGTVLIPCVCVCVCALTLAHVVLDEEALGGRGDAAPPVQAGGGRAGGAVVCRRPGAVPAGGVTLWRGTHRVYSI